MDRSIYVAMTGATQILRAQTEVANNIANASTVGYKAAVGAFEDLPVAGPGAPTRINAVSEGVGYDFAQGPLVRTGRALDVAVQGPGWIAVQSPAGGVGYTRAGDLQLTPAGLLTDAQGDPVLGDNGPISIPQAASLHIGSDGTVSVVPLGQQARSLATVGRIDLVNPPPGALQKGADGLMHLAGGAVAPPDASVHLASGVLEQSNVDAAASLVDVISLARRFDLQVKAIKSADQNARTSSQLIQPS